MPMTQEQINQLYSFTRAHFVEHYDVQTELVDHLANGIERLLKEDSSLSFNEALQTEFKKFGVCGFQDIVQEKRKAMAKRYRGMVWRFFIQWFQWPKLVLTLAIFGGIALTMTALNQSQFKPMLFFGLLLAFTLLPLGYLIVNRKNRELDQVRGGKKWMLSELTYNLGDMLQVPNLLFNLGALGYNTELFSIHANHFNLVFAALITLAGILNYVLLVVIPSKAETLLSDTYPEYQMQ